MGHTNCPQCNTSLSITAASCPDSDHHARIIPLTDEPLMDRAALPIMLLAIGAAFMIVYLAL